MGWDSFVLDARGQSATIGVALLLGLAIVGAVAIVTLGATALTDTQQQSELERAEHMMTQFDSQASLVALGRTDSRSVSFGHSAGTFSVDPGAGHIAVIHADYNGDTDGNIEQSNPDDPAIYEADLGTVVYQNGDSTVVYQGGGVWKKGPSGEARMVSPPEFHYRGATLTLPAVQVHGQAASSGRVSATITGGSTIQKFPSSALTYPDGSAYLNPAEDGQVYIEVTSEYYEGWADYFRKRTEGKITEFPAQNKVRVKLFSSGFQGDFDMPGEGSSLDIRGIDDHSMDEFTITLRPDNTDAAEFNNLQWSMHAETNDRQFEIHFKKGSTNDRAGTPCTEHDVIATVYYSPADGDADQEDPYNGWQDDDAYRTDCKDFDGDGDSEVFLEVDFVDDEDGSDGSHDAESGDPVFTYQSLSKDSILHFDNPNNQDLIDPTTFDGHTWSPSGGWSEPKDYSPTSTETVDRLFNHYFSELGPGIALTVDDKGSNTVTEGNSFGTIQYAPASQFITFIHITENDIEISFN